MAPKPDEKCGAPDKTSRIEFETSVDKNVAGKMVSDGHLNAVHREHVVLPLSKFELYDYDVFEDVWDDIDPLKARHSFFQQGMLTIQFQSPCAVARLSEWQRKDRKGHISPI